jgi:ABC-type Na+ efflux pump permease subunit
MNPIIYSKIFNEVKKNIKLIIRNWSSLVVIILGPLILLALVGYALSGSEIHDLSVGLITNEQSIVSDLQQVMQETATIVSYNLIDDCIDDMKFEKIELCVVIRGNFKPVAKDLASGEVTFYYDNTRPKVTLLLLTAFKQQLGLTSEQIGVTSAGVILNDLSDFVGFLGARINDIGNIEEQTGKIKLDLEQRLINLLEINRSFTPNYLIIKKIQNDLLVNISLNNSLNDSLNDLNK